MKMKKVLYLEIGLRIRSIREELGLTREQLAESSDISSRFLACIENGQSGVSLETLMKIAASLHVSTDYLLYGRKAGEVPQDVVDALSRIPPKYNDQLVKLLHLLEGFIQGER